MDDYFDDEELINDYMDFDEPPPEPDIPEEYLMADTNAKTPEKNDDKEEEDKSIENDEDSQDALKAAMSHAKQMALMAENEATMQDETNGDDDEELINYFSSDRRKKNLYQFQRYTGTDKWRTTSSENKTLNSKIRKRKHEMALEAFRAKNGLNKGGAHSSSKSSTPSTSASASAAQLVHFAQYSPYHCLFDTFDEDELNDAKNPRYTINSKQYSKSSINGKESTVLTLKNGHQIHLPCQYENHSITNQHLTTITINVPNMLLGKPMSQIVKRAEIMKRKKLLSTAAQVDDEENRNSDIFDIENSDPSTTPPPPPQLWVDKHAPTMFSHLLSDERTNREVLRCIREWDPYVFKREPPARPEFIRMRMEEQQQQQQEKENQRNRNNSTKNSTDDDSGANKNNPNDKRPPLSSRVILLCGPPGVGKTTLAHVIAHHAGYQPLEINASDDRTASVLCERINDSMQNNSSLLTRNSKPNCLILDEIDGASDKATMNAIINIIKADIPPKASNIPSSTKPKKSSKSLPYLRRPIILIANHKFAPVLRNLLPYAKVFDVSPPSDHRLVSRLKAILTKESLTIHASEQPLHYLARATGGDIRSCLHTLQFAASGIVRRRDKKNSGDENNSAMADISQALLSAMGGNSVSGGKGAWKDERTDISETLMTIFRKAKQKEKNDSSFAFAQNKDKKEGINKVLNTMESFNDSSKIIDTLFTNLPSVPYIDPALDRSSTAHEWLSAADLLRSFESTIAQNNLVEYMRIQRLHIPPAAAAIHLLCRIETRLGNCLIYNTRKMNDVRYKLEANSNLLHQFIHNLSPTIQNSAGGNSAIIRDLLPYAMWLLSAGDGRFSLQRAVSSLELLNDKEKVVFWDHVKRLRALGLTYVKADEGKGNSFGGNHGRKLRLEPEIDQLIHFKRPEDETTNKMIENPRKEIPSALKELLAHGAAIEAMKEKENQLKNENVDDRNKQGKPILENKSTTEETSKKRSQALNVVTDKKFEVNKKLKTEKDDINKSKQIKTTFLNIGASKAKAARTARKAALVGFDRSKKVKMSNSGSNLPLSHVIRFKYQKGFTQAVRIPCRIEDFI